MAEGTQGITPRVAEITTKMIEALKPPTDGKPFTITWDSLVKGFGVRITAKGTKAFIVDYRAAGTQRRYTIGTSPTWTVKAARAEAIKIKASAKVGDDAMVERDETREAGTLADLYDAYDKEHLANLSSKRGADDIRGMWATYVFPELGKNTKVRDITPRDCDKLHATITAILIERGKKGTRANRVIESLRKAINMSIRWGWRPDNPASGVRRNNEEKRERYLSDTESNALLAALDGWHERQSADVVRLLTLTGARLGEVLGAKWEQFDLDAGVWVKPAATTKQRKLHRVPLNSTAKALLQYRREAAEAEAVYVFPGNGEKGHQTDLKRSWLGICKAAGLVEMGAAISGKTGKPILDKKGNPKQELRATVRLHDLRHTFASVLVSAGHSLPVIGALLGHTQAQTTQRYAHLFDDPLRVAAEAAAKPR